MKAETQYFSNLTVGGPRGTWGGYILVFVKDVKVKFSENQKFQSKIATPKSPHGPPSIKFEKYTVSFQIANSLETIIVSSSR